MGDPIREPRSATPQSLFPAGMPVRFSPDGEYFALPVCLTHSQGRTGPGREPTESCFGEIDIYRLTAQGPAKERTLPHLAWVDDLAFSLDSGFLIAGTCESVNGLSHACRERKISVVQIRSGDSERLEFLTPSTQHFAVGSTGAIARTEQRSIIVSNRTGSAFRRLDIAENVSITMLTFGAGERLLAAGTGDGRIFLRRLTAEDINDGWSALHGHSSPIAGLQFSEDGERLISSSADGTVLLHRTSQNHSLGRLLATHSHGTTAVAFDPNGRMVISGGWDGTIKLWRTLVRRSVSRSCSANPGWTAKPGRVSGVQPEWKRDCVDQSRRAGGHGLVAFLGFADASIHRQSCAPGRTDLQRLSSGFAMDRAEQVLDGIHRGCPNAQSGWAGPALLRRLDPCAGVHAKWRTTHWRRDRWKNRGLGFHRRPTQASAVRQSSKGRHQRDARSAGNTAGGRWQRRCRRMGRSSRRRIRASAPGIGRRWRESDRRDGFPSHRADPRDWHSGRGDLDFGIFATPSSSANPETRIRGELAGRQSRRQSSCCR